uniref:Uncharacterized protein n=1 Tax=Fagus sylvatica TaxID=28930 RepID=A0A2N9FUQ2_FAGSY
MADLREILPFSCSSSSSLLKSILPASRSSFLLGKASGFFESFMNSPSSGRNSMPKSQELNANAKKSRTQRQRQEGRDQESEGEIVRRLCDWIGGRGGAAARV